MRFFYVLSVMMAAVLLSSGCKMDSDVLASWNEGKITRGDFREYLEIRKIPEKSVFSSIDSQKGRLRQIAVEKMTVQKAVDSGLDRSADYIKFTDFNRKAFMSESFKKHLYETSPFEEEAVRVSVIRLKVRQAVPGKNGAKNYADEKAQTAEKLQQAQQIMDKITAGLSFESAAEESSEDVSRKKGGDLGFITRKSREADFTDLVFSMNEGEIKGPVKLSSGVYIIKLTEKSVLTDKNISSAVKDEKDAKRLSAHLRAEGARKKIDELKHADDVSDRISSAKFSKPDDVLFSVADNVFRVQDLNDILRILETVFDSGKLTDDRKAELAEAFMEREILYRAAAAQGMDKDPQISAQWNAICSSILAAFYRNINVFADVEVTESMIRKEYASYVKSYNEMKNSRMKQKGFRKADLPKLESYEEMKGQIRQYFAGNQKAEKNRKFEEQLLEQSGFTVNEDQLVKSETEPKPDTAGKQPKSAQDRGSEPDEKQAPAEKPGK